MSTDRITVGIDGTDNSEGALDWAVEEANSRRAPIGVVYAYAFPDNAVPLYGAPLPGEVKADARAAEQARKAADGVVATVVARVRAHADVEVDGYAIPARPQRALIDASNHSSLLVLGSRQAGTVSSVLLGSVSAAVAARAHCPAVVVRGTPGLPEDNPAVVVGIDGYAADQTLLAFAFDYATRHGCPLNAVLCWHPAALASMSWRLPQPPPERAEARLSEALAGWRERYPDVEVHASAVRDHAVSGLLVHSLNQRLLVVGSHNTHALPGTLLGSVSQGVLHHALCPVAVLPTHDRRD